MRGGLLFGNRNRRQALSGLSTPGATELPVTVSDPSPMSEGVRRVLCSPPQVVFRVLQQMRVEAVTVFFQAKNLLARSRFHDMPSVL